MTKKITLFLVLICCLIMAFYDFAAAGSVVGSKHDFSRSGLSGSPFARIWRMYDSSSGADKLYVNEVCVFCHTPHAASTSSYYKIDGSNQVLWNRVVPVGAGAANNMYDLYQSPTLTRISVNAPTGSTLMCLSCHDGVTSVAVGDQYTGTNVLLNPPGTTKAVRIDSYPAPGMSGKIGSVYNGDILVGGWGANIGELDPSTYTAASKINLSNDHPVSFDWVDGLPGMFAGAPTNPALRLFGSTKRMECATCHNVHDETSYPPFLVMSNTGSAMCRACHDK